MAQIIDGYTLTPNIFAEDIGKHNISMYGSGDYVLSVGECLGYELVSNNEIRIKDGMFLTQGRRGLIKTGTADTCIIENGAQAVNRNDLIVMEYKKDEATLVESHTTKVIKGTPGTTAVDPELVTGDIQNGAVLHQMPLYRVKIEGLNIVAVEQMFEFGSVAAETVDPMLATEEGFAADALKTKQGFDELNYNLEECFQSVSDGKAMVASAITDKGVSTASDATFATMAEHIGAISTGLSLKKIYGCSSEQKKCTLDNLTVGKSYLVIISSFSSNGWNTAQSTYAKISSYTGCTLTELFYTNDASNSASRFYKMVPTATSVTLTAAANETAAWTVCE